MKALDYLLIMKPSRIVGAHSVFWIGLLYAQLSLQPEIPLRVVIVQCLLFFLFYGGVFIMNDLFDLQRDRSDPVQSNRKIASGAVPVHYAIAEMLILFGGTLIASYFVNQQFFFMLLAFLSVNLVYSTILKRISFVDIFVISITAPMKFVTGCIIFGISVSHLNGLVPILLFAYVINLFGHAEKRLVRIWQGRNGFFTLNKYSIKSLMFLLWCCVIVQAVLVFYISGVMQLFALILVLISFGTTYGISKSNIYRKHRFSNETKISKL